ncbi:MAG: thiamine pyrophosphokinae, catalytic region [Actinomycetia bacterium]|nr:thiamine pyrophosphokinae, catalytic region [Actinomycetes bacterium]
MRRGQEIGVVRGPARVGRRTKDLTKHLRPGDIVVIDHEDLDRVAAEGLVLAEPAAVVNAAASVSGRYPNVGPLLLAAAGIPLVDGVGSHVMDLIADGTEVVIDGDRVTAGEWSAVGHRQTMDTLEDTIASAKASMGEELQRFAENTLDYLRRERHLVLDEPDVPDVPVDMKGRHVLVAVRGPDYREDLAALRHSGYLNELRPVLVAVDGAADALLELGKKPDIIIGDMDSVSEKALRSGAVLVVHAFVGGKAPGAERLRELGLDFILYEAPGTSEDIAMLMAYERGAELIVAVGTHNSMTEFLDKGRPGMASTFLVRMKVGNILVDAKGVSRLYQANVRKLDIVLLVAAAVFALLVVTAVSQPARLFLDNLWNAFELHR